MKNSNFISSFFFGYSVIAMVIALFTNMLNPLPALAQDKPAVTNIISECGDNPFCEMQTRMNSLFNHFLPTATNASSILYNSYTYPRLDLINQDEKMLIHLDLPGMSKDDIEVNLFENHIEISGERKASTQEKGEGYYIAERSFGTFKRIVSLPAKANIDKAEISYDNGVLEIIIPKVEPKEPKNRKMKL